MERALQSAGSAERAFSWRRLLFRFSHATFLLVLTPFLCPGQQVAETPFTPADRWAHYLRRTYGPDRLGILMAETSFEHLLHDPEMWDRSATSLGRRFGVSLERRVIRNTAEMGAGLVTGEDLRYSRSQSEGLKRRMLHSAFSSVTARMPSGRRRPAYTRFFAAAVTEASTAHWRGRPISGGGLLESLGWSAIGQVQTNLLDEFAPDLRRVGRRLWRKLR